MLNMNSRKNPKVSVIMPHYNDGKYLPQAVESILGQTFSDFEFIIIDDGSTDEESLETLRECGKLDSRIRIIYNKENRGPAACCFQASEEAQAPYIHGIGADDIRYSTLLEVSMNILQKRPELGMSWSPVDWGKEGDIKQEDFGFEDLDQPLILTPEESKKRLLTQALKVSSATGIYRTDLSKKYGHYITGLSYFSDWFLLNLILLNHPTVFIPKSLAYFRVREGNYSNVMRHNKKNKIATYKNMLGWLNRSENRVYREQFRKTALLTPLFHDLFWKMLFNPRYIHYWPYIAKKYPVGERVKRSLFKRFPGKLALQRDSD